MKPSLKDIRKTVRCVIFDLDGTLIDSMWMWAAIDVEYLARFGHELPDDYQKAIEGLSFDEVAVYTKERFHIPDDTETMKNTWNEMAFEFYKTRVPLKPGVRRFLRFLKRSGIKIGIATSNSRLLSETVLSALKIDSFVDNLTTGSEIKRGKPAPDIYLHVAKELGMNPADCLVFEDVEAGAQAAVAAGMRVCAVYDENSSEHYEKTCAVSDYFINDFGDFKDEDYKG